MFSGLALSHFTHPSAISPRTESASTDETVRLMHVAVWAEIQPTGRSGEARPLSRYLNSASVKFKRDKPCRARKISGFYQGPVPSCWVCILTTIFLCSPCFVLPCLALLYLVLKKRDSF